MTWSVYVCMDVVARRENGAMWLRGRRGGRLWTAVEIGKGVMVVTGAVNPRVLSLQKEAFTLKELEKLGTKAGVGTWNGACSWRRQSRSCVYWRGGGACAP